MDRVTYLLHAHSFLYTLGGYTWLSIEKNSDSKQVTAAEKTMNTKITRG
jgi:hypothetical protein